MLALKYRDEIVEMKKNSYASDVHVLPVDSIDCTEGVNPFGCPAGIAAVLSNDSFLLDEYPHDQRVFEAIRDYWAEFIDVEKGNMILTDGSISGIYIINNVFARKGAKVLGVSPQFTDYVANAKLLGMEYRSLVLDRTHGFQFSEDAFLDAISEDLSLIYIDNPNNPTGQIIPLLTIRRIVEKAKALGVGVIIDEAYGDFMTREESAATLLAEFENLIVIRTMSKGFALAGVRAAYILANKGIIEALSQFTNPYAVGAIGRRLIAEALNNGLDTENQWKYFRESKELVRKAIGRKLHMSATDDRVPIFTLYHSDENVDLIKDLAEEGIIAVEGDTFESINNSCARVRLPKPDQFAEFMRAIIRCENK